MKYYLLVLSCIFPLMAMYELPPQPTAQELHSNAINSGIGVMLPVFLLILSGTLLADYVLTLPAAPAVCAATVALLEGVRVYHKERYPTPQLVKWKELIALRPQIINTIKDIHYQLDLRAPESTHASACPKLGLTRYKSLYTADQKTLSERYGYQLPNDQIRKFVALCKPYEDQKVPASALMLHLAKCRHKLEQYKQAMIELAPYDFTRPDQSIYDKNPETSFMDLISSYGDPELPVGRHISNQVMGSCRTTIAMLTDDISDLRKAMGE